MMKTSDDPHTLGIRVEAQVLQVSPYKKCRLRRRRINPGQPVVGMAETPFEKMLVAGEKGWVFETMKHANDIIVSDAETRDFLAY